MSMGSRSRALVSAGALAALVAAGSATTATAGKGPGLEVGAMVGLPAAYATNAISVRGLQPGGLPWEIGRARAEVKSSGKVEVTFKDLLFAPGTGAEREGKNTIGTMKVIVSCLSADGAVANVSTEPFPVSIGAGAGDGSVESKVTLPDPCLAPLVFVTTMTDRWLAVSAL
jgi:hypothetical protein